METTRLAIVAQFSDDLRREEARYFAYEAVKRTRAPKGDEQTRTQAQHVACEWSKELR
jgi:hypothetical protein